MDVRRNDMETTASHRPVLSDDAVRELLGLMRGSDSVELKLTVPADDHRATIDALGLDPLNAQIRQVYFLDTPDLQLNAGGLVARVRRVQGRSADSVVKLRPVEPARMPGRLRKLPEFGVEVDAMPGGFVCSGSLKGSTTNAKVAATFASESPIRRLFTKEQRQFFKEHAPGGLRLEDLTVLGPIFVLKSKLTPRGYDRPMVAEMWLYPDGSRVLELSTKCLPTNAFQTAMEAKAFLTSRGVDLTGAQETKTRKALEYFTSGGAGLEKAA
jgi:hypothetical protein